MSDKIIVEYEVEVNGLKAQMKEVQESFKTTEKAGGDSAKGVSNEFKKAAESTKSLKTQLRELKAQLANATDPKDIERLAKAAGKLTDQIEDATDAAKVFASESKFEQVGNALGSVASKLRNLDFKGAADQSKLLVSATKSITFSEALGGVKQLGTTLLNVGKSLLMNPIFLIGAAVTAIIANFDKLANSGGLVGKIFKGIGDVVGGVKDGFLSLTDAIGLTDTAANEAAENIQKYYTDLAASIEKDYARIVKVTKASGKETTDIERKKAIELANINERQYTAYRDNLIRQGKTFDDLSEEEILKLKEFGDKKADLLTENEALYRAKLKEENDKKLKDQKEYNEKLLLLAKELRDLTTANIEDGRKRELEQLQNAFNDKAKEHKGQTVYLIQLEERYRQDKLAVNNKYDALERDAKAKFDKEIQEGISQSAKKTTDIFRAQLKDRTDLSEEYTENELELIRQREEVEKQLTDNRVNYIIDALRSIETISNNITQQRLNELENASTKEQEIIKAQYEQGMLSREDYDRRIAASKLREEEESKKIQLAAFKRNKALALINVAINTAEAITKYLGGLPATAPLIAIATALGALQAGVIASQPTPKFAKGVVDLKGKGTKTSDEIPALLSRGESVITADATATDRELFKAFNKGKGQKYIYEVYVAPALKEQLKKHSLSKDSSFAQNIANSMMLNSGKLNDGNILESLKMQRKADKENIKYLAKVISKNNYNARSW